MQDIKNFLDEQGRLIRFPAKQRMKIQALAYLATKFDAGKVYSEKQVNETLELWHTFHDPATLRRELFDFRFMDRTPDCREYRLCDPLPDYESPSNSTPNT
ncbi:MAG: DUF2087 domain-containing protein [Clostridia bacterium]|nr:DUF2087 domain-containing protein [Clostridia bacterium]